MVSATDSGICHRRQHFRGGLVRLQARFMASCAFMAALNQSL